MSEVSSQNRQVNGMEKSTWIIAFSRKCDYWFVTNQRNFDYEYPVEFKSEQDGIDFFLNRPSIFFSIEAELKNFCIGYDECVVYLDNVDAFIEVDVRNC